MPSEITLNIYGSCVSREPFNFIDGSDIRIKEYIHKSSPFFCTKCPEGMDIEQKDVELDHNFIKRSVCTLFNGTAQDRLLNNKGDWILLDNYYFDQILYRLYNEENNDSRILQFPSELQDESRRIVKEDPKYSGYRIERLHASPNFNLVIERLAVFLENNWGSNIIFIDAPQAQTIITEEGDVKEYPAAEGSFDILRHATDLFLKRVKCITIKCPQRTICKDLCRVHYSEEMYRYLADCLREVLHGRTARSFENDAKTTMSIIDKIVNGEKYTKVQLVRKINNLNLTDSYSDFENRVAFLVNNTERYSIEGEWVKLYNRVKDRLTEEQTVSLLNIISPISVQISNYLFDLFWNTKSRQYDSELLKVISPGAESQDDNALQRLGKMYLDGRGVVKDSRKGESLIRQSIEKGNGWSRILLFDILWARGNPSEYAEMIDLLSPKLDSDPYYMLRMGRAYRFGKGVEQNYSKSASYMSKVYECGFVWIRDEYLDVLWEVDKIRYMEIASKNEFRKPLRDEDLSRMSGISV